MPRIFSCLAATALIAIAAAPALAANKTVKVDDDFFSAKTVTINKGNTVTWKWVGDSAHDVKFGGFRSSVKVNGSYKHTFRKRGTFRYVCSLHTGMTGKVIVK